MSVLIKGMDMPERCGQCFLRVGNCKQRIYMEQRPKGCPLVEITSQGRLVDADAHILEIRKQYCEDCSRRKGIKNGKMKFLYEIGGVVCRACEIEDMLNALDDAPTVIEGSETDA